VEEQSYAKHAKFVPLFHYVLIPLTVAALIGSLFNLYRAVQYDHNGMRTAVILVVLSFAAILTAFFARIFALKAQDRAIRGEENLRHFVLTGKLLDRRLSIKQIIGLRFASDAEFPDLARKAADENLPLDAIKKSVKSWRADTDRL
jgi:L-cystine uptake protein TcyP (sodium:dicarboxylate symporter family)